MKRYNVEKWETIKKVDGKKIITNVADYGVMCEEDVALTVRGYKGTVMEDGSIIYTRNGSKFSYIATEVN